MRQKSNSRALTNELTAKLWDSLWPGAPDAMNTPFHEVNARLSPPVSDVWKTKDLWMSEARTLYTHWGFPLRIIVMYANMSDAFYGCGADFMSRSQKNEDAFVSEYENWSGVDEQGLACQLLARSARVLRLIGFKESLVSISADLHYYCASRETQELVKLARQAMRA